MSRLKVLVVLLAILATGCTVDSSEPVSLGRWQKSLERYVWQQGDGDPTVLRDLSWDDVHPGFAVLGDALPARSTDMFGLLVAHRHVEGKPYFIFLVATVHDSRIEELEPVALNVDAGRFRWFIGSSEGQSTRAYEKWVRSSETDPDDGDKPIHFPAPADTFEVSVVKDQIRITHDQTGATWELPLGHALSQPGTKPAEPAYRLERMGHVSGSQAS